MNGMAILGVGLDRPVRDPCHLTIHDQCCLLYNLHNDIFSWMVNY